MQIHIRLPAEVGPSQRPLPPALATIGANEAVIIELQGSIEIEGEKLGEFIGNLDVTNIVRTCPGAFTLEEISRHNVPTMRVITRNKHVPSFSTSVFTNTLLISIQEKPTLKIAHHLLEGRLVKLQKPLAVLLRNDGADPVSFDMVAIVKQKLVFSKRPVPIVGASAVGLSASSGDGKEGGVKRRKLDRPI
jgi:chromosome transmission fidelity protein 8